MFGREKLSFKINNLRRLFETVSPLDKATAE